MNKLTLIVLSVPLLFSCSEYTPTLPEIPTFSEIKEKLPDMPNIIPDSSIITPYKDDVFQGSVLDRYSVNQLKIGMTKLQVTELIGSPSIIDLFHNTQWDYIHFSTLHEKEDIRYRLTLKFNGDLLSEIDQTGLENLPPLSAEEKALEEERIAQNESLKTTIVSTTSEEENNNDEDKEARILEEKRLIKESTIAKAEAEKIAKAKAEEIAKAKAFAIKQAKEKTAKEAKIAKEKSELIRYKIIKGDTLTSIAYKYNTTVNNLKTINELRNDNIRADDYLLVPSSSIEQEQIAKAKKAEDARLAQEKAEAEDQEAKEKRILEEALAEAQKEEDRRIAEEAKKPWYQFW